LKFLRGTGSLASYYNASAYTCCYLQAGTFDPFSDDPQLGVQKIALCCATETLFVGGTAGQVIVLHFEQEEKEVDIKVSLYRCYL